ncbi:hypothetical protein [Caulobacter segnis]
MFGKVLMSAGLLLALAGCEQKPVDTPKHFAPPALWRIEVVEDSGGQTGVVMVCANPEVVSSFSRVEPNINGAPCQLYGQVAKDTADEHIKRCQVGDTRYGLYVTTTRHKVDDFTVRFALQPLTTAGGKVVQARRYQRIGPCPTGWKAGDQGPPGGAPTSNVLSGQGPG